MWYNFSLGSLTDESYLTCLFVQRLDCLRTEHFTLIHTLCLPHHSPPLGSCCLPDKMRTVKGWTTKPLRTVADMFCGLNLASLFSCADWEGAK